MITLSEIRSGGPFGELAAKACAELRFRQAISWQINALRDEVAVESDSSVVEDAAVAAIAALSLNGEGGIAGLGAWVEGSVPSTRFLTPTPGSGRRHAKDGAFLTAVLEAAAAKVAFEKVVTIKALTPHEASLLVDSWWSPEGPQGWGIISPKEGAPTWWRQLLRLAATAKGLQDAGLEPGKTPGKTVTVEIDGQDLLAADISPQGCRVKVLACLDPKSDPNWFLEAIG